MPGLKLPPGRYDFIDQLARQKLRAPQVGMAPYAINEWAARLTVAFAEHRRWPNDPAIQQKCLIYAGLLSHYAADLCQPLHTTIHHDGRARSDGSSPKTGIHMKVDALAGKLADRPADLAAGLKVEPFADVFAATLAELDRSHALVERVYELEAALPAYAAPLKADSKSADFARERMRESGRFVASLYVTAWRDSAKIKFPDWHQRPPVSPDKMATTQKE